MASVPDLSKVSGTTQGDSEPGRISGQYHSTKGSIVEAIGNATGASSWRQAGKEERDMGDAEYKVARAKELGTDSVGGNKTTVDHDVAGNEPSEVPGKLRQEKGEDQEKLNH